VGSALLLTFELIMLAQALWTGYLEYPIPDAW